MEEEVTLAGEARSGCHYPLIREESWDKEVKTVGVISPHASWACPLRVVSDMYCQTRAQLVGRQPERKENP